MPAVAHPGDPHRGQRAAGHWPVLYGEDRRLDEAAAIRAEQTGLIARLLRELPSGWEREPDGDELDTVAHIIVGTAEVIAFWAVERPHVTLNRVADHLMPVLEPVVCGLPTHAGSPRAL